MGFEVLRVDGRWREVKARWSNGSKVRGWISARDVSDLSPTSPGGLGFGGSGRGCCDGPLPEHITVRLEKGAKIFSLPSKAPWAVVRRQGLDVKVRRTSRPFAELLEVPGVSLFGESNACLGFVELP